MPPVEVTHVYTD